VAHDHDICDLILENHPYGYIWRLKYLIYILLLIVSSLSQCLKLQEDSWNISKIFFALNKNPPNSKILIISRAPIWVIIQNLVTYIPQILGYIWKEQWMVSLMSYSRRKGNQRVFRFRSKITCLFNGKVYGGNFEGKILVMFRPLIQ